MTGVHCVTGAFGYSGRHIARALLRRGDAVSTLTGSPDREHDFGDALDVRPLSFGDAALLRASLQGVRVLYNTYWIRFSKAGFSQAAAVRSSIALFAAARDAGVERIVHVSITNPSEDSPYEYFRGKAVLERELAATGVPHTILRPAVFFGGADILINNIAWMLRHLPVFGVVGDGAYRLQPIHVEDFAALAVSAGTDGGDAVVDAIGPETWGYRDLVTAIAAAIGRPAHIARVPRAVGLLAATVLGRCVGDVVLTGEELDALRDGLLATPSPPTGTTALSTWLREHGDALGRRYAGEVARRRDRRRRYADI